MNPQSIGDMIGEKLGKQVQSEYNRLLEIKQREILKHGLKIGMQLGKSVIGDELPDGYVDDVYKKWKGTER